MSLADQLDRARGASSLWVPPAQSAPRGQTLEQAFPDIDPGVTPLGSRVLVQIRTPRTTTKGGLILADETQETEKWNTQVARVTACGPLAFHNRNTGLPWPEGSWVSPGDYVRCPKYGGDRWEANGPDGTVALFVIFNDLDLIGKVTGDPRQMKAFI